MEEGAEEEDEEEDRRIKDIWSTKVKEIQERWKRTEFRRRGPQISSFRRQQEAEVEMARRKLANVIASARQNARESMEQIRNETHSLRRHLDVDHSPGGATDHRLSLSKTKSSKSSGNRLRRPEVTSEPAPPVVATRSVGGACQLRRVRLPPPPVETSTYLNQRRSKGRGQSRSTLVAMTADSSGLNRSVTRGTRLRIQETTKESVTRQRQLREDIRRASRGVQHPTRKAEDHASSSGPCGGGGGGGGGRWDGWSERNRSISLEDNAAAVKHSRTTATETLTGTEEEGGGEEDSTRSNPTDNEAEEFEEEQKQGVYDDADDDDDDDDKQAEDQKETEDDEDVEEEEVTFEQREKDDRGGGQRERVARDAEGEGACLLSSLRQMELTIRDQSDFFLPQQRLSSGSRPQLVDDLWPMVVGCSSAVESVEDFGDFEVDERFKDWMLTSLQDFASICYRFVVSLIPEFIEISQRGDCTPDEHRLHLDAAMLAQRTCQKMIQPVVDQQVSVVERQYALATPLVQVLSVHLQNLRLILALFAFVNRRGAVGVNDCFAGVVSCFVSGVFDYLSTIEGSLQQMVSERMTLSSAGGRIDNSNRWPTTTDENNSVPVAVATDDLRRLSTDTPDNNEDVDDRGHSEVIGQGVSLPVHRDQYFYQATYDDSQPLHHHHHHHHHPPSHAEQMISSSYSEEESQWSYSVAPTYATLPSSSTITTTTDYENEDHRSTYLGRDLYGRVIGEGGHVTLEEEALLRSMPGGDQRMSLADDSEPGGPPSSPPPSDAMDRVTSGDTFDVVISRSSETLLDDVIQVYTDAPRRLLVVGRLKVIFEEKDEEEEAAGVDASPLLAHFFCLVFRLIVDRTVKNRAVFEGQRGHLLPAVDHVLSESKVFWIVGVMVAQAAGNGCRGLPWLSPAVRRFLADGARVSDLENISQLTSLEDVADLELRQLLKKVVGGESLSEKESFLWENWLETSGFSFVATGQRTADAVRRILRFYVFESRMSQLLAIAEGMEDLGWRPVPRGIDPDVVFPPGDGISLEDFLRSLLINEPPTYEGRSHRVHRALRFFRKFCAELNNGEIDRLSLPHLLHFFTGAPYLQSGVSLTFMTPDQEVIYPQARTCNLELIVPTMHRSYKDFRNAFCQALHLDSSSYGSFDFA